MAGSWQAVVACAWLAVVADVFVDQAVAVIVDGIAHLGGRGRGRIAHVGGEGALPGAVHARDRNACRTFGRRSARANSAAGLKRRGRDHVFIDYAVAVIVIAVAALLRGYEDACVFALLIVVQIVVAGLAAVEHACAVVAAPC